MTHTDDRLDAESSCCPRVSLPGGESLSPEMVRGLEAMFKTLANGTRLRLLYALIRAPGLCVTDLAEAVGMKPQAVSNQLQRLVDRGILSARRNGTRVHYRIDDPCVAPLLAYGCCLAEETGARAGLPDRGRGVQP